MSFTNNSFALLANAAATGNALEWRGGPGTFVVLNGTFSGATVALQWSPDGGTTWIPVDRSGDTYLTFTSGPQSGNFDLPPCQIRAAISGGPPSGVNALLMGR